MNDYKVQVVYKDAKGWERCCILKESPTEQAAFDHAETTLKANNVIDAEIMVHKKGSTFWKVKDQQGRITQRPTTEAIANLQVEEYNKRKENEDESDT